MSGLMLLSQLRPGHKVLRHFHVQQTPNVTRPAKPMELIVSDVSGTKITCGAWVFDRATGAEVDPELGWGPAPALTGSYIVPAPVEAMPALPQFHQDLGALLALAARLAPEWPKYTDLLRNQETALEEAGDAADSLEREIENLRVDLEHARAELVAHKEQLTAASPAGHALSQLQSVENQIVTLFTVTKLQGEPRRRALSNLVLAAYRVGVVAGESE